MFFPEVIEQAVAGYEGDPFAKIARLLKVNGGRSEDQESVFDNLFHVVVRIAKVFEIISDVYELMIHFHPLQLHQAQVKGRDAAGKKQQGAEAEGPAGDLTIVIQVEGEYRRGERPEKYDPEDRNEKLIE